MEKRQTFISRLDENVIITMLAVSVIACMVLAFKYKNYDPCTPYTIRTTAAHYRTGEIIRFDADIHNFKMLKWNYGDNQNDETKIASAVHTYDQPGEYTVALSADSKCTQYKMLIISPAPKVVNEALIPKFVCPQSAEVGKPVTFQDTTKGAKQWEWRFGETATVDATAISPTYVYSTPGLKTVSLVVNNDPQQLAVCKVFVNPAIPKSAPQKTKPDGGGGRPIIVITDRPKTDPLNEQVNPPKEPPPAEIVAFDVSKQQFETELRQVADKQRTAESFLGYMCGNPNIQVSLNGSETTFANVCNLLSELKSSKKIKRINVQMVKNEHHCIVALVIDYKKKEGFLGL